MAFAAFLWTWVATLKFVCWLLLFVLKFTADILFFTLFIRPCDDSRLLHYRKHATLCLRYSISATTRMHSARIPLVVSRWESRCWASMCVCVCVSSMFVLNGTDSQSERSEFVWVWVSVCLPSMLDLRMGSTLSPLGVSFKSVCVCLCVCVYLFRALFTAHGLSRWEIKFEKYQVWEIVCVLQRQIPSVVPK